MDGVFLRSDSASLRWLVNYKEREGMLARWLSVHGTFKTHYHKAAIHGLSRQAPRNVKEVTAKTVHWKGNTVFVL